MKATILFLTTALLTCLLNFSQGQVSQIEKKIIQSIDNHNEEAVELLKEIVNINSGSMNFEGVKKVGEVLKAKFDGLGMETRWVDGTAFSRAGHLIAQQKGKGPTLLLIGHLDTVFEPTSPFQEFKMLEDNIASGPGIDDMKGGDIVILQAIIALNEVGALKNMNIIVVMTGDEELSGRPLDLARKDLIEAAKKADIALGFENGDGQPSTANISRRSSSGWELKVTGVPAHSSQIFREDIGVGAIYELSRILYGFYENLAGEELLTFNPGMVIGGSLVDHDKNMDGGSAYGKSNIVAETAISTGDIRCISPEQLEKTQNTMKRIASRNLPHTSAELTFGIGYPPLAPTEDNKKLLRYYSSVSEELGFGKVVAVDPLKAGAADISFTAPYVDMAIDGLGLGGTNDHTVNETADLSTLPSQTKRAAILIYRLSTGKYK